MNEKVKSVFNVLLDIVIVLFMLFCVLILVVALTQKTGNVSHLFGYTIRSVQTESMEKYNEDGTPAEGAFFVGDLIICKVTPVNERSSVKYNVGDAVMFYMPIMKNADGTFRECQKGRAFDEEILVTHNIVDIKELNGSTVYYTKGINVNSATDINPKVSSDIIAVYTGTRIPGVGAAIDFVQTSTGFLVCVILPIAIFVIIQAIRVIRNFIAYKAQKLATEGAPSTAELSEEEKRRIAEEYLRQQKIAEDDATSSTVETADGE